MLRIVQSSGRTMNGAQAYSSPGRDRPLGPAGSARRGTALPAHERRLLLPLRADRSVGANAAADAGLPWFHVVASGGLAGGRRTRPHLAPSWRPRARATRRGAPSAQRTRAHRRRGSSSSNGSPSATATRSFGTAAAARRPPWSAARYASTTPPHATSSRSCRGIHIEAPTRQSWTGCRARFG